MAIATGNSKLSFPAERRRLAPCRSGSDQYGAFLKLPIMRAVIDFSVAAVTKWRSKTASRLAHVQANLAAPLISVQDEALLDRGISALAGEVLGDDLMEFSPRAYPSDVGAEMTCTVQPFRVAGGVFSHQHRSLGLAESINDQVVVV